MRQKNDNDRYLEDLLAFGELVKPPQSRRFEPFVPSDAEGQGLAELFEGLRRSGREALARGADIRLEKLVRKQRLDEAEALILTLLTAAALAGDEDLNAVASLRKTLRSMLKLGPAQAHRYWRADAPLMAKRLVLAGSRGLNRAAGAHDLFLAPDTLDYILARQARRPRAGAKLSPAKLYEKLGEYVVGQDAARRALATAVYRHQLITKLNRRRKGVDRLQRANVLLIGPTGTGKTHLCRTLAQILDLPFLIADATQYTETGYVGACVEEMLAALYEKGDPRRGGIIFIDEVDKIAARNVGSGHNSNRDVSGLSVQQELLKLLDGDLVTHKGVEYDVSRILFIAGGAFSGLEEIVGARLSRRQVGFLGAGGGRNETVDLRDATVEDLIAYGFAPEFLGRFAGVTALDPLGKDELIDIMTKPRNSLVSQYQALFKASGVALQLSRQSLEWVAGQALSSNTGARGLKAILEKALAPALFEQASQGPAPKGEGLKALAFELPDDGAEPEGLQA